MTILHESKLVATKFISSINNAPWFSPMVIIAKENNVLQISMDFQNLNATTRKDHCPLPNMHKIVHEKAGIDTLFLWLSLGCHGN